MKKCNHSRCESFSSLGKFGQCKARYKFEYIDGIKRFEDSPALQHGRNSHILLEKKDFSQEITKKGFQLIGLSYPLKIKRNNNLFANLYTDNQTIFIEQPEFSFAIGSNQELLDFFDSSALFRGKVDLVRLYFNKDKLIQKIKNQDIYLTDLISSCYLFDWKTGKKRNDKVQLRYYSLFFFLSYPNIQKITCRNVFLDLPEEEQVDPFEIKREEITTIWEDIQGKVNKIQQEENFNPRPSGLCSFCPYTDLCKDLEGGYNSTKLTAFDSSIKIVDGFLQNPLS